MKYQPFLFPVVLLFIAGYSVVSGTDFPSDPDQVQTVWNAVDSEAAAGSDDLLHLPVVRGVPCDPCERAWCQTDFLLWWGKPMWVPPLVTSNPGALPALDDPNTTILFGDEGILGGERLGLRVRVGMWLDTERRVGIEGDYFFLGQKSTNFFAQGDGVNPPWLGRPFFSVNPTVPPPRESAQEVSTPGRVAGSVSVGASSDVASAGLHLVYPFCCRNFCFEDKHGRSHQGSVSWSLLAGYRYMRLSESLAIVEDLQLLIPPGPGPIFLTDAFDTDNEFHGAEIGTVWRLQRGQWVVEALGRLALGTNRQTVGINGSTSLNGAPPVPGGFLAARTNIGGYRRNDFAMVPELGVKLGYQLTERLAATCGYSFIYFSRVVRPGEQIDLDVNVQNLPPFPVTPPLKPAFVFNDTDFWVQGLDLGLEYRY